MVQESNEYSTVRPTGLTLVYRVPLHHRVLHHRVPFGASQGRLSRCCITHPFNQAEYKADSYGPKSRFWRESLLAETGRREAGMVTNHILGIVVAIIGSFVNSLGLLLQKLAHVRNAALPPERRTLKWVVGEHGNGRAPRHATRHSE